MIEDLKADGPIQKSWNNFSPLGDDQYHCHLNYRYVACWTYRQGEIEIEGTMLALVKKPRIELSLQGENVDELVDWISKKYEISILTPENSDSTAIEETDFWKEMQSNRIGNLLSGARLKANLSQSQLADKLGVRQNMISDYERGKRRLSPAMAKRIAEILHIKVERIS
jgi:DNA-binding XRE family transcriptional regulator